MAKVYVYLYKNPSNDLTIPKSLFDSRCEIECLKWLAPDDGERVINQGKYCITCPDDAWKEVIDKLRGTGKGLFYAVEQCGVKGEVMVPAAGELNTEAHLYARNFGSGLQALAFWFGDFITQPAGVGRVSVA